MVSHIKYASFGAGMMLWLASCGSFIPIPGEVFVSTLYKVNDKETHIQLNTLITDASGQVYLTALSLQNGIYALKSGTPVALPSTAQPRSPMLPNFVGPSQNDTLVSAHFEDIVSKGTQIYGTRFGGIEKLAGEKLESVFKSPDLAAAGFSPAELRQLLLKYPRLIKFYYKVGSTQPPRLAIDSKGAFYVSTTYSIWTPDGTKIRYLVGDPLKTDDTEIELKQISDIDVDPQDNLYVTDISAHTVYKVTPQGHITVFAGSGKAGYQDGKGEAAAFSKPSSLAINAQGTLFIADTQNKCIRRVDKEGNVSTLIGSGNKGLGDWPLGSAASPVHIAVDNSQKVLYVLSSDGATWSFVQKINVPEKYW